VTIFVVVLYVCCVYLCISVCVVYQTLHTFVVFMSVDVSFYVCGLCPILSMYVVELWGSSLLYKMCDVCFLDRVVVDFSV
jgi:hypothetical protein